jgi:hypothetical protein
VSRVIAAVVLSLLCAMFASIFIAKVEALAEEMRCVSIPYETGTRPECVLVNAKEAP